MRRALVLRLSAATALVVALAGCTPTVSPLPEPSSALVPSSVSPPPSASGPPSSPPPTPDPRTTPDPTAEPTGVTERPSAAWKIPGPSAAFGLSPGSRPAPAIEGYADQASVAADHPFDLYVSTSARRWRATAYRMGWYGGRQGARVWRSGWRRGRRQAEVRTVGATRTPTAPWRRSLRVATTGWRSGAYLVRLEVAGHASFVPLLVRSPTVRGRLVLLTPSTTWQAYNDWGGRSLYWGPLGKSDTANRARAVSYDRPYVYGHGGGELVSRTLPVVALAERRHLALAYVDDVDLERDPHLLDGARGVVSMGHDEYYSVRMRAALTRARDAGANLAFLGANAVYRRIRLTPTALGPRRLEVNYKDATEDPLSLTHPEQTTADWPQPPAADPESSLTGSAYACFPASGDLVVAQPRHWALAHTGLRVGDRIPGILGPEFDAVTLGSPSPHPIDVVLRSPVRCGNYSHADATYYSAASGAGVFNTGTMNWVAGLSGRFGARTQRLDAQITTNVLRAFAAGPAGRAHPVTTR